MGRSELSYRLYDQILVSTLPLALSPMADDGGEELRVWRLDEGPVEEPAGELVHDVVDFDGVRRLRVWTHPERVVLFSYGDTRIEWRSSTATIRLQRGDLQTRPAIALERMAAPIAMILERPRHVALHASAVVDDRGGAWIFAGESGVGKSTTALGLMRRGLSIVADDLVLCDVDRRIAMVATPSLRLFDRPEQVPEAIEEELVMPEIEKFWYRLPESIEGREGIPLRGIFSLEPDDETDQPRVERLRGQAAMVAILAQSFDLTDAPEEWRSDRFRALCDLAREVPVYRVIYSRDDRGDPAQVRLLVSAIEERGAGHE